MILNIKIVIPFYSEFEVVKPGLRALREKTSALTFDVQPVQGPYVHTNRNLGVNQGKSGATYQKADSAYTHFLFIDSDISFHPKHVIIALAHNAPVVTLPYLSHENNGNYQVGELGMAYTITRHYDSKEKGVKHVTFTGGGFLLVRADVFSELRYPWFHHSEITIAHLAALKRTLRA